MTDDFFSIAGSKRRALICGFCQKKRAMPTGTRITELVVHVAKQATTDGEFKSSISVWGGFAQLGVTHR